MSILTKIKEAAQQPKIPKKLFGVITGRRLAGKTTLVGTLKGHTLLLQASVLESGSGAAEQLAKELDNQLTVHSFSTINELRAILVDLIDDEDYDNIYVDGLSAITEMKMSEPKIATLVKRDNWAAFREIGEEATEIIKLLKTLTYPSETKKAKNCFLTCALLPKQDQNGVIIDVALETKGNMAVSAVTKFGEAVITVVPQVTEQGVTVRQLLTKTDGVWPGRIDYLLDHNNPGIIEPADLSVVVDLFNK